MKPKIVDQSDVAGSVNHPNRYWTHLLGQP
jgi:hypothetical protein